MSLLTRMRAWATPGYWPETLLDDDLRKAADRLELAERLEAPARELLTLYDWRPELAKKEKAALDENGGNAEDRKEVKRLLREYGERKKAGWIALRAALESLQRGTENAAP